MKKDLIKRISTFFLTAFLIFSCAACSSNGDEKTSSGEETPTTQTSNHVFQLKDTDKYVVKDGKTDYTLVYPSEFKSSEITVAIDEFTYFFEKATGITIEKKTDEGLMHSENGKYISLGDTSLLETSGLTIDKTKLGLDGLQIQTKDDTIYIIGGTDRGVLYGVYTFLEVNFDFDCFTDMTYAIDEVNEFKLKEYSITDIPDFGERGYHLYYINDNPVFENYDRNHYKNRMRLQYDHYRYIPVYKDYDKSSGTSSGDNAPVSVLPYNQWKGTHPKWYSDRSGSTNAKAQLCYTAHGDSVEYEAMIAEAVKKLQWSIENRPTSKAFQYAKTIQMSIADNLNSCTCKHCNELAEKYGAESAGQILLINEVADRLKAWQATLEKDDPAYIEGLTVEISAYIFTTQAPAKQNDKGEWEPTAEEMLLRDNVAVKIAYIDCSSQKSMFDEDNLNFVKQVNAWKSLGGAGIHYFMYNLNYTNQNYFYDCYNFYTTEGYRFMASVNPTGVLVDGKGEGAMTGWYALKVYLDSKMYWNSSLDVQELIDKWFVGVYKDVAPKMKEIFNQTRVHTLTYQERYGLNGNGNTVQRQIEKTEYYPLSVLNSWIASYDEALVMAEKYKYADPDGYELICRYIEMEALSPLIAKARLYYNELSQKDKEDLRARLVYDVEWLDAADCCLDEFYTVFLGDWVKTL